MRTFKSWWFDDDPRNFAFVHGLANPLRLFIDSALAFQFSGTPTLNPMLGISIWLDSALAYRSFLFAELHSVVILAATLFLMFLVLRNWGLSLLAVCVLLVVWLLSPATVVVSGWLAARHHLEGITWSLGALLLAQGIAREPGRENSRNIGALFFLLGGAALFKETFAITVPLAVGLYLWHEERRRAALACGVLLVLYCVYRSSMVGLTARYQNPLLSAEQFVQFLARLPHILVGSAGGYLLLAIVLAALVLMVRRNPGGLRIVLPILLVIASSLIVIYPGAFALHRDWLQPRTWVRIVLLFQTGLLIGAGVLLGRLQVRPLSFLAGALALPITAYGGFITQKDLLVLRAHYTAEGKYYLSHTNRLLYSEVPASWYLAGIDLLYDVPVRHHVTEQDRPSVLARLLPGYAAIWRYSGGKFVKDVALLETLRAKAEQGPTQ